MDASVWFLLAMTALSYAAAFLQRPDAPAAALRASGRALRLVGVEVALGFLLAGVVEVLVPATALVKWLGAEHGGRAILVGWGVGLALPGGPYVLFPIMANLFQKGVGAGALITLITAKTLVSPTRMLTYEAPLMGWPITLARFIPGLLVPPILGVIGQWLFDLLARRPPCGH